MYIRRFAENAMTPAILAAGANKVAQPEMALRQELAAAYRLAARFGWEDSTSTHFTVRLPGPGRETLINHHGELYDEVTASSLVKVGLGGEVIAPAGARVNTAGFTLHSAIHTARPDALCVMHCHSVASTAVGAQEQGLLPLSGAAMTLYGAVGYHGFEGLRITEEEMPRLLANLGDHKALILRNHGTLTLGPTVAACFQRMFYLEKACQMQIAAMAGGARLMLPDAALAKQAQDEFTAMAPNEGQLNWTAWLRALDRSEPGYRD
ncbi:MAG: putative aldolase class [Caulobacteraceae bacterium]|nr:putative aldolase class [Caulobacteraceae bacterium]